MSGAFLRLLGAPIARGMTAEVYAWDETRILKLFRPGWSADRVEHEAHIARVVHARGLPVPAVGDFVEIDGRHGLLYERVDGPSMMDSISRRSPAVSTRRTCDGTSSCGPRIGSSAERGSPSWPPLA